MINRLVIFSALIFYTICTLAELELLNWTNASQQEAQLATNELSDGANALTILEMKIQEENDMNSISYLQFKGGQCWTSYTIFENNDSLVIIPLELEHEVVVLIQSSLPGIKRCTQEQFDFIFKKIGRISEKDEMIIMNMETDPILEMDEMIKQGMENFDMEEGEENEISSTIAMPQSNLWALLQQNNLESVYELMPVDQFDYQIVGGLIAFGHPGKYVLCLQNNSTSQNAMFAFTFSFHNTGKRFQAEETGNLNKLVQKSAFKGTPWLANDVIPNLIGLANDQDQKVQNMDIRNYPLGSWRRINNTEFALLKKAMPLNIAQLTFADLPIRQNLIFTRFAIPVIDANNMMSVLFVKFSPTEKTLSIFNGHKEQNLIEIARDSFAISMPPTPQNTIDLFDPNFFNPMMAFRQMTLPLFAANFEFFEQFATTNKSQGWAIIQDMKMISFIQQLKTQNTFYQPFFGIENLSTNRFVLLMINERMNLCVVFLQLVVGGQGFTKIIKNVADESDVSAFASNYNPCDLTAFWDYFDQKELDTKKGKYMI